MDKVCKLILVGNGSVGKTSICQRFKDDGFMKVYRQTIGVDFLEKKLELR
jgi:GTPase SAR1 family protein